MSVAKTCKFTSRPAAANCSFSRIAIEYASSPLAQPGPDPRTTPIDSVAVTFESAIDASTFDYNDITLTRDGGSNLITPSVSVTPSSPTEYVISGLSPLTGADGEYELRVDGSTINDSGGSVFGGEDKVRWLVDSTFVPLDHATPPKGSLIYDGDEMRRVLGSPGNIQALTVEVDPGQTISVSVTPDAALQATIDVTDPFGTSLGSATASSPGAELMLQTVPAATAGTYTVTVGTAASTTGDFEVQVTLNAALELEAHGGATDDTLATAQDIDGSFINLTTGSAQRGAVLGSVSAPILLFGSNQNGQFLIVDRATGASTVVASGVNGGTGYADLARNPVTGVPYGSGARGDNGFYVVNPVTGAGTLIGPSGNQVHSLAWSPDGTTLYAVRNFNEFGTIDAGTGTFPYISSAPSRVHGMAFHPATGVLYAVPQTGELDTVDTGTGAFTFVGNTSIEFLSLEFLPDGSLLGSGNGSLYSIDPATGSRGSRDGVEFSAVARAF